MAPIAPAPAGKSIMSPAQIATAVRGAGFPDSEITTGVAVALAESSGNEHAVNTNANGSKDYGLFQINSVHKNLPSWDKWYEGMFNAGMAHRVWEERRATGRNGWTAWTTYNSGAYKKYLTEAGLGATDPDVQGESDPGQDNTTQEAAWFRDTKEAIEQVGNALAGIAQAVFKAMVWFSKPHNWVRAALVGMGGAMAIGALVIVAKPQTSLTSAVTQVPKKVTKAATAPVRAAAKAV